MNISELSPRWKLSISIIFRGKYQGLKNNGIKTQTHFFVCIHIKLCSFSFNYKLTCTWIVNQFNLLVEFSSKTVVMCKTPWKKLIQCLWFLGDFIHSCHHCLEILGSLISLKKNKFWSIDLTCWRSTQPLHSKFLKALNTSSWKEQIFWKFTILSNILDLEWCLSDNWKLHSATVCHV